MLYWYFLQRQQQLSQNQKSRKVGLDLIQNLTYEEKECLLWQSNVQRMNASQDTTLTVCYHHKMAFLAKFTCKQMSCCNLFGIYTGFSKAKGTSVIDLQTAKNLENKFPEIVPGLKFCPKCLKLSKNTLADSTSGSSECKNELISYNTNTFECQSNSKSNVSSVLNVMGSSALKLHGLDNCKKVKACKRKVETIKKS